MSVMRVIVCAIALGHLACAPALAAIDSGDTGELFLNIVDSTAKISYTQDLGLTLDDFFIAGQPDGGTQQFYVVGLNDGLFTQFLNSGISAANLTWSVLGIDNAGGTGAGAQRLYTTVTQGQESRLAATTNTKLSTGIATTVAGNFFSGLISSSLITAGRTSHNTLANGSSYSLTTDGNSGYYGKTGGLTPNFNANTAWTSTNPVGSSSWFYKLTRSSSASGSPITIDEFDNGDGSNAASGHDGYWGLLLVADSNSPYNGKYLLSYTLEPRVWSFVAPSSAQREFAASVGRTEITGGQWVTRLDGAAAAATLEGPAGWITPLGAVTSQLPFSTSAVPEPASLALWLAGLGLLAGHRQRRQRHQRHQRQAR